MMTQPEVATQAMQSTFDISLIRDAIEGGAFAVLALVLIILVFWITRRYSRDMEMIAKSVDRAGRRFDRSNRAMTTSMLTLQQMMLAQMMTLAHVAPRNEAEAHETDQRLASIFNELNRSISNQAAIIEATFGSGETSKEVTDT